MIQNNTDAELKPNAGIDLQQLKKILAAAILAAGEPLSIERLSGLFSENNMPAAIQINEALESLSQSLLLLGLVLKETASGYCIQIETEFTPFVARLFEKRPPKYSRALLETLALIAYRQPVTRAQIEDIRGVSVSTQIFKTLMEREWIRIIGHKDVPGKPALYATTKKFLDYFNLKNLQELPPLIDFTPQYLSHQESDNAININNLQETVISVPELSQQETEEICT